jgi:hypothetical protein
MRAAETRHNQAHPTAWGAIQSDDPKAIPCAHLQQCDPIGHHFEAIEIWPDD